MGQLYVVDDYVTNKYVQTGITVSWDNRIIFVPKSETTLVQSYPTEIRELSLNAFRLALKDLEDDPEEGMCSPDTHSHNTEVAIGGLTYARVIEIINNYTVTFEDGQYAVNLTGANSNVGDVVNVNQVSVRSNNSAGMTSSPDIEYGSFNGYVSINTESGVSGTVFPAGTPRQPVNNIIDAKLIADYRGFKKIFLETDLTISEGIDFTGFVFEGNNHVSTVLTIEAAALVDNAKIIQCTLEHCVLDNNIEISQCIVKDIQYVNGHVHDCGLVGTIVLSGNKDTVFANCYTIDQDTPAIVDMGGMGNSLAAPNYSGVIWFKNQHDPAQEIGLGLNAGYVYLMDSITAGIVFIAGSGLIDDQSTGSTYVNIDGLMNRELIAKGVWDEPIKNHLVSGSTGLSIGISQYAGVVTLSDAGEAGTDFPLGNSAHPVNNLADAVTIAEQRGITTFQFISDWVFTSADFIVGYTLKGEGYQSTTFTCEIGCILAYCSFTDAAVTGGTIGTLGYENCLIKDFGSAAPQVSTITVNVNKCLFQGVVSFPPLFQGKIYCIDCVGVPYNGLPPVLDMGGGNFDVEVRNYSGFIIFEECSNPASDIRVMLNAGGVVFRDTITAGNWLLSGIGTFDNQATGTTTLDESSLINKAIVATAVWDEPIGNHLVPGSTGKSTGTSQFGGVVYISVNGTAGTEFPQGTESYPVNNAPDALAVSIANGITVVNLLSDFTIGAGTFGGYTITGRGRQGPTLTVSGTNFQGAVFESLRITGTFADTSSAGFKYCTLADVYNVSITADQCVLDGTIGLSAAQDESNFYNCFDGVPGIGIPDIQVGDCTSLGIWNWNGGVRLSNISTVDTAITLMIGQGRLWVDSTCVEGNIIVKGMADLKGTTGGTTIDLDGLVTKDTFSVAVWDEPIGEHLIAGTTGKSIGLAEFGGMVHIDEGIGQTGTAFPLGTGASPVNNVTDAYAIASANGLFAFHLHTSITVKSTEVIYNMKFVGRGSSSTLVTFESGCVVANCSVEDASITGLSLGLTYAENCKIKDYSGSDLVPSDATILFKSCAFEGDLNIPGNYTGNLRVVNCYSIHSLVLGAPTINFNGAACVLLIEAFAGAVGIKNCTSPDANISIDLISAAVYLASTVTAGLIKIRGVGILENLSSGATVNTDGLMSKSTVATAVWDEPIVNHLAAGSTGLSIGRQQFAGVIHVGTNGTAGTEFPIGTEAYPVNNVADALAIAMSNGIHQFSMVTDFTVGVGTFEGYTIIGNGRKSPILTIDGTKLNDMYFKDISVTGTFEDTSVCEFTNCTLIDVHDVTFTAANCVFGGNITLGTIGDTNIYSSFDLIPGADKPIFSVGDCLGLGLWNWVGGIMLTNMTNPATVSTLEIWGRLTVDASNTQGSIIVRGPCSVYGETGGTVVVSEGALNQTSISETVWGTTDATENTVSGTMGAYQISGGTGGGDVDAIADAVWADSNATKLLADVSFIKGIEGGRWEIENNQMIFYAEDNITEVARFNLYNESGVPGEENIFKRVRV